MSNAASITLKMNRRHFLNLVPACMAVTASCTRNKGGIRAGVRKKSFYVAGVRFCKITEELKAGEPLKIKEAVFAGEPCYEIFSLRNERVGYVPRALVSSLRNTEIIDSYVANVDPHAVLWKRYKVTVASLPTSANI
jgi:hypothetical protein